MLKQSKIRRQKRVRSKITGTFKTPRVSVYRSNRFIYAQAINDASGETLASVSEMDLKEKSGTKSNRAKELGGLMAEKLKKAKVGEVVFDRGSFRYHGRVKNLAEGLREGGIKF